MAGYLAIKHLKEGQPVLWLKHRKLPTLKSWHGVNVDMVAPFFRRGPSASPKNTPRPLQVLWDRHRITLQKRTWEFELNREFGESNATKWSEPWRFRGTHFSKQLNHALNQALSFSDVSESTPPILSFFLEESEKTPSATSQDEMSLLESSVESMGGVILDTSIQDIILEGSTVWGAVLSDFRGVIPSRHILLADHLTTFQSIPFTPIQKLVQKNSHVSSRRFVFSLALPNSELPEIFSGEALLLDHPDYSLTGERALYVQLQQSPTSTTSVLTVRMDCPLVESTFTQSDCERRIRAALGHLERRLIPALSEHLIDLDPPLTEANRDIRPLELEHHLQLTVGSLPAERISLAPGLSWYGPEAWGRWGWFAPQDPFRLPTIASTEPAPQLQHSEQTAP